MVDLTLIQLTYDPDSIDLSHNHITPLFPTNPRFPFFMPVTLEGQIEDRKGTRQPRNSLMENPRTRLLNIKQTSRIRAKPPITIVSYTAIRFLKDPKGSLIQLTAATLEAAMEL